MPGIKHIQDVTLCRYLTALFINELIIHLLAKLCRFIVVAQFWQNERNGTITFSIEGHDKGRRMVDYRCLLSDGTDIFADLKQNLVLTAIEFEAVCTFKDCARHLFAIDYQNI